MENAQDDERLSCQLKIDRVRPNQALEGTWIIVNWQANELLAGERFKAVCNAMRL